MLLGQRLTEPVVWLEMKYLQVWLSLSNQDSLGVKDIWHGHPLTVVVHLNGLDAERELRVPCVSSKLVWLARDDLLQ